MKFKVMLDENAKMPTKAHETDAGFDLYTPETFVLHSKEGFAIDTGVHIDIPKGYVGFLKSKSGLNVNSGMRGEGVIDAGYTGSIVAKLYNDSNKPVYFEEGQKIIQIVFLPIPDVELELTDSFEETERGDNGFGSSGKFQKGVKSLNVTIETSLKQTKFCLMNNLPALAPSNGICPNCKQNIYADSKRVTGGMSVGYTTEDAGNKYITQCPHCMYEFPSKKGGER